MIETPKFCIGHIMRTGGDTIKMIFEALASAGLEDNYSIDSMLGEDKHRPFPRDDRIRVLSFRRLPEFTLSCSRYFSMYLGAPEESVDECCQRTDGDKNLIRITNGIPDKVDYWINCNCLRSDLALFLHSVYKEKFDARMRAIVNSVAPKARLDYDHSIKDLFSSEHLATLYSLNPEWTRRERIIYGSLL